MMLKTRLRQSFINDFIKSLFMARKQWSKSDIKEFISIHSYVEKVMTKKSSVFEDDAVLFVDNIPCFFQTGTSWIPTLHLILKMPDLIPSVTVDKGAIKFVINGADIMRPGIVSANQFSANSFVVIIDENYSKPLAVGRALLSSTDLLESKDGKVILNLHRIGDEIWNKS
jgi:PUA domain protein